MLIKCTKCGHQVSNKAKKCPNCGCPIDVILNNLNFRVFCAINYHNIDITWIKHIIDGLSEREAKHYKYICFQDSLGDKERWECKEKYMILSEEALYEKVGKIYWEIAKRCNLERFTAAKFLYQLMDSNFELKSFVGKSLTECKQEEIEWIKSRLIKCPYCSSINTKKIFFGGYAQKQWHCNNCGSDF